MIPNKRVPQEGTEPEAAEKNLFYRTLDAFQKTTKLKVRFFPVKGKEEINPITAGGHHFCQIIQGCQPGRKNCLKEIHRATQLSVKTGEPNIYRCHAGVIGFTAAFLNGNNDVLAFVCSPILMRPPDASLEQEILNKVRDLPIDQSALIRILPGISVFPEQRLHAAADLLFMIVRYFLKPNSDSHRPRLEIPAQQTPSAGGRFRNRQTTSDPISLNLPSPHLNGQLRRENELIGLIKIGDWKRAKGLLDDMMGTYLLRSHEQIEVLKARALEIIFIVVRAAVESGANLEEVFGFKYQCIQDISREDSPEILYGFLRKVFDQLFECVYKTRNIQHTGVFLKTKEYIWRNYNREVSLKTLSEAVGISPYYLSHLFRKEMGLSFMEYLTSVRMSIARTLLRQTSMSVLDVCLEVGYRDPSHFAKIFRKREGTPPMEYRLNQTSDGGWQNLAAPF